MSSRPKSKSKSPARPAKAKQPAKQLPPDDERDITLSRKDAAAGAPADYSVAGEEDPGVGLEFMVRGDI